VSKCGTTTGAADLRESCHVMSAVRETHVSPTSPNRPPSLGGCAFGSGVPWGLSKSCIATTKVESRPTQHTLICLCTSHPYTPYLLHRPMPPGFFALHHTSLTTPNIQQLLALTWVEVSKALEALDAARMGHRAAVLRLRDSKRQVGHLGSGALCRAPPGGAPVFSRPVEPLGVPSIACVEECCCGRHGAIAATPLLLWLTASDRNAFGGGYSRRYLGSWRLLGVCDELVSFWCPAWCCLGLV